jgi:hypothetical protein
MVMSVNPVGSSTDTEPLDFTANDLNDIRRTISLLRSLFDELLEHMDDRDVRWRVWSQVKAAHGHLTELIKGPT